MAAPRWLTVDGAAVVLTIYAQPRASRTRVVGAHDDALKVQLAAPPVDGEANAELCAFLAKLLGIAKRQVTVESGESSRRKRVRIIGCTTDDLILKLR